jgi:hypothetical protein
MYTNETEQMMKQGGVNDQGGTIDAVSGNDVPPGALQKEVRDDISAKLSPGEFVIPADVVRYVGLENLMKMRDKAKAGLQKMEEIGQMGNSKSGAEGEALHGSNEESDDEFSSSIDEIMNDGEEKEYKKGGYVPAENAALYSRAPIKGFEMIPMTNDTGNVIYIPFINGKPQLNIPPGYVIKAGTPAVAPVTGAAEEDAAKAKAAGAMGGEGGGDYDKAGGLGYTPTTSLSAPGPISFQGNVATALDAYGNVLGGMLPGGLLAKGASKAMMGSAAVAESKAVQAAIDKEVAKSPSFGGGGYGTSVGAGGFGVTSVTGAGISANPMSIDPATAQGQRAFAQTAINNSIANNTDPAKEAADLAEKLGVTVDTETGGVTVGGPVDLSTPTGTTLGTQVDTQVGGFQSSFGSGSVGGPGISTAESTSNYGNEGRTSSSVGLGLSTAAATDAATSNAAPTGISGVAYGGGAPAGDTVGLGSTAASDAATSAAAPTGSFGAASYGGSGSSASTGGVTDSSGAAVSDSSGAQVGTTDFGDRGGGGGGGGGGCFLTTAAVDHMNEKDDGEVLSTLREFRDTYMKKNKEKSKDVAWYYDNAPKIVAAIDARQDAKSLYTKMYNRYIKKAYRQIKSGDLEEAYTTYKAGIDFAKKSANIKKGFLEARSSVKDSEVKKVKTGFVPR